MIEFLPVAAALIEHPQADEAFYRSAISRQYYALFLLARNKLGIDDASPDSHRLVIDRLSQKNGKAGEYLQRLRGLRNRADYLGTDPNWQKSAQLHQSLAESMAKTIQALK